MKQYPSIPRIENAPRELLASGHCWIREKIDGANVRFQLRESGLLVFGDRSRVYDSAKLPEPYRHAARHVQDRLDRDALREAATDVESLVFFGEATHRHAIEYDWERIPSFLGFAVWSGSEGAFLPPDAVDRAFSELGLEPVNAIEREVRAADFDPDRYEIPASAWYDGPAEGVVIENKNGLRAKLLHPRFREVDETIPVDADADALARRYATDRRVEKLVRKLENRGESITFDAVYERVLEDIVREEYKQLHHADDSLDLREFRSTVAERVRRYLDG